MGTNGSSRGPGFGLGQLVHLVGLAMLTTAIWPPLLTFVHLDPAREILQGSLSIRIGVGLVGAVVMGAGFALIGTRGISSRTQAWEQFAQLFGRTVERCPRARIGQAWKEPIEARVHVGDTQLVLEALREEGNLSTRVYAPVIFATDARLYVWPESRGTKLARSPLMRRLLDVSLASSGLRNRTTEEQAKVHHAFDYLFGDDIQIGDPEFDARFLVRCDDPALAREVFDESDLRSELEALAAGGRFVSLSIEPDPSSGEARLTYVERGFVEDPERLLKIHSFFARALERIAQMNAPPRAARRPS